MTKIPGIQGQNFFQTRCCKEKGKSHKGVILMIQFLALISQYCIVLVSDHQNWLSEWIISESICLKLSQCQTFDAQLCHFSNYHLNIQSASFCHFIITVISSICHFINLPFSLLAIQLLLFLYFTNLPIHCYCHLINSPFSQLDIQPTSYLAVIISPFHQLDILLLLSFHQFGILSTHHFVNKILSQLAISSTCHFIKLPIIQSCTPIQ